MGFYVGVLLALSSIVSLLGKVPLIASLRGAGREQLQGDVVAGLTTAVMLVPQAMAYALLAGLDPIVGLYASTIPLALYALFGSSRELAVGPVAMVSLLVATGIAALGTTDPASILAVAAAMALLVGAIQLIMGLVKLGFLVKFLSHPVLVGFSAAAALIIGSSQLKHVLGVSIPRSHYVHETLIEAARHLADINVMALGIGLASIVALVAFKRFAPRFPRFLFVVAAATVAVWGLGADVAIVGSVPGGLPSPHLPSVSWAVILELLPIALTISLVAFMESIAVAKAFARQNRVEVDPDQELRALGLANLAAGLFRGYPITGGFSRTAVNAQAGAKSGLASLTTAGVVALSLLFLTPLFFYLPKAVLAAIIMTAVASLVNIKELRHLWRVSRADFVLAAVTFVATLTLGIELGIVVGVAASILWFVASTSKPHIAVLGRMPGSTTYRNIERNPDALAVPGVLAVRIDAPLFFANTAFLKKSLKELEKRQSTAVNSVLIDASAIGSVDASGAEALLEMLDDYRAREIRFALAAVRGPVLDVLRAADSGGVLDGHVALDVDRAVEMLVSTQRFIAATNGDANPVASTS